MHPRLPHAPLGADVVHVVGDRVRDTAEYVLLSRAVDRLGAHKLGDEWVSAHKLRPFVWLSSPDTGNAELADQRFAAAQYLYRYARHVLFPPSDDVTKQAGRLKRRPKILARIMPRDEAEGLRSQLEQTLANLNLTEAQYELAFRMTQQDKVGWNNLRAIQEEIVQFCQYGKLASAARPILGGAFVLLDRSFWNTERWTEWFKHSTVNLNSPYNFSEPDHYVFISTDDINSLCGQSVPFHEKISASSVLRVAPTADVSDRSGGPGAPSSMHLIELEMQRRHQRGEMFSSITEESEALSKWVRATHPNLRPATPKTIRNKLTGAHRRLTNSGRPE